MSGRGMRASDYPGFDRGLVERSWTYIGSCGTVRLYDSEELRSQVVREFPQLDWESQLISALCAGIEGALDRFSGEPDRIAIPLVIRCRALGFKVPVDLRYAIDAPGEQIGAVMRLLPAESLPVNIRFGDPAYLEAQKGKGYAEAIEGLRELSLRKRRFFTCNEIDHHLFTHVFDNGNYRSSFQLIDV